MMIKQNGVELLMQGWTWDGLTHGLGWIGYEWQYMVIFTALVRVKVVPQRLSQGRMFIYVVV